MFILFFLLHILTHVASDDDAVCVREHMCIRGSRLSLRAQSLHHRLPASQERA